MAYFSNATKSLFISNFDDVYIYSVIPSWSYSEIVWTTGLTEYVPLAAGFNCQHSASKRDQLDNAPHKLLKINV